MSDEIDIELHGTTAPPEPVGADAQGLVVVATAVLEAMDGHVAEDTTVEHGGVMVGRVDPGTGATVVTGSIRAVGSVSDIATLTFTHETWDHVGAVMEAEHPEDQMVGWYHSHPHFGIFLSDHDQFIHRNFFGQPWQIAYVRDPLLDQRGFFSWVDGQIVEVEDWQEIGLPVAGSAGGSAGPTPLAPEAPIPAPLTVESDDGGLVVPPPPAAPKGKGVRNGLLSLLALVLVIGAIVVAGQLIGGPNDEPVFDITVTLSEDSAGAPGDLITVATVELVEPRPGERVRLTVSQAVLQAGDDRVRVVPRPTGEGTWVLEAQLGDDVSPGLYDGTVSARICEPEGPCVGEPLEVTPERVYQFEVVDPAAVPTTETTPAPSLVPDTEPSDG